MEIFHERERERNRAKLDVLTMTAMGKSVKWKRGDVQEKGKVIVASNQKVNGASTTKHRHFHTCFEEF